MGVPAFFKWVQKKYPLCIVPSIEDENAEVDTTLPNPNGYEFDNLYLDMNGLIHPCVKGEVSGIPPSSVSEMYQAISSYIDRIMDMIRPRKLLYLAIDGVAPRAKMNQQRSRRFRTSWEEAQSALEGEKIRNEMRDKGMKVSDKKKSFDKNVITPGTEFMFDLAQYLRYYILDRINNKDAWKNITVIFSDASVPGEGEHKIIQYIREQRVLPGYNSNATHCFYGLDADLILLTLATHEPHFTILREEVEISKATSEGMNKGQTFKSNPKGKPFELLRIFILRQYLSLVEFSIKSFQNYESFPFEYNFEAIIDDFVFMSSFVGNDFLPHLPSLEIREGALELLMSIYRKELCNLGGYLVHDGIINLKRTEAIFSILGEVEDLTFKQRHVAEEKLSSKQKMNNNRNFPKNNYQPNLNNSTPMHLINPSPVPTPMIPKPANQINPFPTYISNNHTKPMYSELELEKAKEGAALSDNLRIANLFKNKFMGNVNNDKIEVEKEEENEEIVCFSFAENLEAAKKLKKDFVLHPNIIDLKVKDSDDLIPAIEKVVEIIDDDEEEEERGEHDDHFQAELDRVNHSKKFIDVVDEVSLGLEGWKERYYKSKFKTSAMDKKIVGEVVKEYIRGLQWVALYYFKGCPSWTWFYPYHYSPFASDMINISDLEISFGPSAPFKPFEQLLSVLPPASAHALPSCYHKYMTHAESEIIDFYPTELEFDPNGKPVQWMWICILPFIDADRLLKAMSKVNHLLTPQEIRRSSLGVNYLYTNVNNQFGVYLKKEMESKSNLLVNYEENSMFQAGNLITMDKKEHDDAFIVEDTISPHKDFFPKIEKNQAISLVYSSSNPNPERIFLLDSVILPPVILSGDNLVRRNAKLSRHVDIADVYEKMIVKREAPVMSRDMQPPQKMFRGEFYPPNMNFPPPPPMHHQFPPVMHYNYPPPMQNHFPPPNSHFLPPSPHNYFPPNPPFQPRGPPNQFQPRGPPPMFPYPSNRY